MSPRLTPKILQCKCGHEFESVQAKTWCQKCCRPVFYLEKDQRRQKYTNYYFATIIAMVLMFMAYFFVEMIAGPLMSLKAPL
jgi:predicted nucleic acid-binding Zn ribbon protein